jgi:hypothetical protein
MTNADIQDGLQNHNISVKMHHKSHIEQNKTKQTKTKKKHRRQYRCAPVSADSVSVVSVIHGSPRPEKKFDKTPAKREQATTW